MAKTVKCRFCKTVNGKYDKLCKSCGKELYPEISYKNARIATIILDLIFAFVYLFGIYLFIRNAGNDETPKYIRLLPASNTVPYFLIIILFLYLALSKILYVLNEFTIKKETVSKLRRVNMFIEAITMFPLQTILALYFYEPATNENKKRNAK